jgi:hypothetical protein
MDWTDVLSPGEREVFTGPELLDIRVSDIDADAWQMVLDHLRAHYPVKLLTDGKEIPLPARAREVLDLPIAGSHGLRVQVGNLSLNEYFLSEHEIEFDLHPREISSIEDVRGALRFMKELGDLLGCRVTMSVEGSREDRGTVYAFQPGDDAPKFVEIPRCPVCDYALDEQPWSSAGGGSYEICPRCGIQFGYTDDAGGDLKARQRLYAEWRREWRSAGSPDEWVPKRELVAEMVRCAVEGDARPS